MRRIKMVNWRKASVQIVIFLGALIGCQPDNEILDSSDTQNINSESASSALVSENSEIALKVIGSMTNTQYAGARFATDTVHLAAGDSRLSCATTTLYRTGTKDAPSGTIVIDFGTSGSCADSHGVVRKGQIIISYSGKRWMPGSTFTVRLNNFYRNSAHIEGTEHTSMSSVSDTLRLTITSVLDSGKITFGDGKTVERNETLTRTWYRFINATSGKIDPTDDEWHVSGSASGVNKNGAIYLWQITSPLVYRLPCWLTKKVYSPVKGVKVITVNGVTYTLNYGDGACDNQVTVTLPNGNQKVITLSNDGN